MADVDMGLKFEGGTLTIEGESTLTNLESQLTIQSFSWGIHNGASIAESGGFGQGRAVMSEMSCTMFADKSAPVLFKAVATNDHYEKITLTLQRSGGERLQYMKFTMEDAVLSSCQKSGGGGNVVMLSFSIVFKKMTETFTVQNNDGSKGDEPEHDYDQSLGA
jgi:type VI secretion system secreted protein Hcp